MLNVLPKDMDALKGSSNLSICDFAAPSESATGSVELSILSKAEVNIDQETTQTPEFESYLGEALVKALRRREDYKNMGLIGDDSDFGSDVSEPRGAAAYRLLPGLDAFRKRQTSSPFSTRD